jgi:2-polyprenyl-6-methoxyphenol hydroxylase-like FAD-dependent oxidoreductase
MSLGNDGSSIFCYAQPGGATHFSYTMHAGSEAEVGGQDNDRLLDRVREATSGWHPLVAAILGAARTETIGVRGYYDRLPPRTVTDGPVWLLGDAAHAMSPFQGQGGNTAMLDALDLANLLASGYPPVDRARLDKQIVDRGRKMVLESRRAAAQFHATSRFKQRNRNVGFRIGNAVLKLFSRR